MRPRLSVVLACGALCALAAAGPAGAGGEADPVAPGVARAYVLFKADVTKASVDNLLEECLKLARSGVPEVDLMISTSGGDVAEGIAAYNVLRSQPFRLVTYNVGQVASAGAVLFLAGTERYAAPHSSFVLHGVGWDTGEPRRVEEGEVREMLERIRQAEREMADILAANTGLSLGEVAGLLARGATLGPDEALKMGIVTAVRAPEVPADNPIRHEVY